VEFFKTIITFNKRCCFERESQKVFLVVYVKSPCTLRAYSEFTSTLANFHVVKLICYKIMRCQP